MTFRLLQTKVYLIAGQRNIQQLFSRSHKIGTEAFWIQNVLPNLYCMSREDVERFANDKSGRERNAAPGHEHVPDQQRVWHGYHHVHSEFLSKLSQTKPISMRFNRLMMQELERKFDQIGGYEVSLIDFCKQDVATCALMALFGTHFFQLNPNLLDAFWKFDSSIFELTMGLPRWLMPASYKARDRYYAMIQHYLNTKDVLPAESAFVPDNEESAPAAAIVDELVNWVESCGCGNDAVSGSIAMLTFA